jgi:N6-adenosine-specific RNA methylase IME4
MRRDWPFGDLLPLRYGAIVADPAWEFRLRSEAGQGKSAQAHYRCAPLDALAALPVGHLAQRDCAMFMWATAPMLPQALDLLAAWGFRYVTTGAWAKLSPTGRKLAFGTGYVLRSAAELFLVGAAGQPRWRSKRVRNLIQAPVRGHSRKPDQLYAMVEELVDGPYLELFGRQRWPGWDGWGDQLDRFEAEAAR